MPLGIASSRFTFDKEISQGEAERIRASLVGSAQQPALSPAALNGAAMWCGSHISDGDTNGNFDIQYFCGSTRTLPWGFRIAAAIRAIIVGNVNETGLRWWRNGYPQAQNAPHIVPPDYQFHRHNVGPGGTGTLTFAGLVELKN